MAIQPPSYVETEKVIADFIMLQKVNSGAHLKFQQRPDDQIEVDRLFVASGGWGCRCY